MDVKEANSQISKIHTEWQSVNWEYQRLRLKLNRGEVDADQRPNSWTCVYRMILRMRELDRSRRAIAAMFLWTSSKGVGFAVLK